MGLVRFATCVVLIGLTVFFSRPTSAGDAKVQPFVDASLILGVTSDYVHRGLSLSGERPTGLMILEASYGWLFFNGVLVGNDLGKDELGRSIGNLEADATIGLAPKFGNVTLNAGLKYTGYPNGRDLVAGTLIRRERDFVEFFAGGKIDIGDTFTVGSTAFWTPDFYYQTGEVTTLELQAAIKLPQIMKLQSRLTTTAGWVRSDARDVVSPGHGYAYHSVGLEGQFDRWVFDIRYWNTDVDNIGVFDQRLILALGVKLP